MKTNQAALALWVVATAILGCGFYSFWLAVALAVFYVLVLALFGRRIAGYYERQRQRQHLDYLQTWQEKEQYEKERQRYIRSWGKDPGAYEEVHGEYTEKLKKI